MKKLTDKKIVYILLIAAFLTTGCATSYYKIADPVTGNLYYAEKVEREGSTTVFKDARSGGLVTIRNSEVSEVSKKDFQDALKTPKVKESKP